MFLLLGDLPARQVTSLEGDRITVIATLLDLACATAIASSAWISLQVTCDDVSDIHAMKPIPFP